MKRVAAVITIFALYGCVVDLEIGVTGTIDDEEIQSVVDVETPVDEVIKIESDNQDILLTWVDNSDNETGFRIDKRLIDNVNYGESYWLDENTTTYTDENTDINETYCYRVAAYNNAGSSESEEVCTN